MEHSKGMAKITYQAGFWIRAAVILCTCGDMCTAGFTASRE